MVTLKSIANELGLSISVVSRVLNSSPDVNTRVSAATRERVMLVAKQLGFRRNRSAEFMRRGRTAAIGVFLPEYANCLIAELIFGMSEAANAANFPLCISVGLHERNYQDFLHNHQEQSSSGIISYSVQQYHPRKLDILDEYSSGGGKILILNDISEPHLPTLSMDEVAGGQFAAEVLLKHPCEDFFCISTTETSAVVSKNLLAMRSYGFSESLRGRGFCSKIILSEREGDLIRHVASRKGKVGIFAAHDLAALDFLNKARHQGLQCGKDFWLVGYDDLDAAAFSDPPLTSIHQPFRQQGQRAIEKIIRMIYHKPEANELLQPSVKKRLTA